MRNKRVSPILSLFFAILMLTGAAVSNVSAYYTCEDDFNYIREDNVIKITGVLTKEADVVIPDGYGDYAVWEISDLAFLGCDTVVNLTLPRLVSIIGDRAFSTCSSLESITVPEYNSFFCSVDGVLYDKNMTEIIQYPAAKQGTQYTIPEGVVTVKDTSFRSCDLEQIILPSSVQEIGYGAFELSKNLQSIVIPEGVKHIGMDAFYGCTALKELNLPASISIIHETALMNCTALERIEVAQDNTSFCSKDGILFDKDADIIVTYPAGKTQPEYVVPQGVKMLDDYAFFGCSYIQNVTLPESVTYLGQGTFRDCTALKSITIPQGVTWIPDYALYNCSALEDVYFTGSESQWNEINFGSNNEALLNARIHFSVEPSEPDTVYILGDANSDGKVNVKDATMIQKSAASLVTLDEVQTIAADCDENNQVNVRDATAIQKYSAGIATGMPIGWEFTK